MAIDESSFTGETEPRAKNTAPQTKQKSNGITDRKCIAFMGTLVRCGHGKVSINRHVSKMYFPSIDSLK